ncbi:MAG: ABC transporter substrate-binding protein [Erysipelotrichaceae bacterium]
MKKLLVILLSALLLVPALGCSEKQDTLVVGICQLAKHDALDAATQGFKDVLTEEFGDKVVFVEQIAAGEVNNCITICSGFVSDQVDLIMANATAALQVAASATTEIPILGTSITEYGAALGFDDFSGVTNRNISGTSDLAPLAEQAAMFKELLPDVKTVGILYCSSEVNSKYQVKVVSEELRNLGYEVKEFAFADTNDVGTVTAQATSEVDAIYIPTDNTAATAADIIHSFASKTNTPIIAGEEGIATKCGIATLSIDYYQLGRITGEMAVKILKGEADVSTMPIEYFSNPVKKFNREICAALSISVPEGYVAIGE